MARNWLLIQAAKAKKMMSEKALTLTITKLNELLTETTIEALGPEEGFRTIFEGGMSLGHEFMMELSAHLEPAFERIPAYGEAAWLMFAGRTPTGQSFTSEKMDDETIWIYRLQDEDCPFCRNISFPHKFCWFPAGAYQGASQTWATLVHDGAYHTLCRETKCKAVGDPYCELTLLILRREVPIESVKRARPEWFTELETGFVDY